MESNTDLDRLQQLPETDPEPESTDPDDPDRFRPHTVQTLHIGPLDRQPRVPQDLDAEFLTEFGDGEAAPEAGRAARA